MAPDPAVRAMRLCALGQQEREAIQDTGSVHWAGPPEASLVCAIGEDCVLHIKGELTGSGVRARGREDRECIFRTLWLM